MLTWRKEKTRVLIVGTRAHTRCLYLYIPEFPQINVQAFVSMDQFSGESESFDVYPETTLAQVKWEDIDAVLVSTHEYQDEVVRHIKGVNEDTPITILYDAAGDSLIYVLPGKWPVMNPHEAAQHGLSMVHQHAKTSSSIDFDFQPAVTTIQDRYGFVVNYHYCHPTDGNNFKGLKGIHPEDLDAQIRILKQNFTFVTASQLLDPNADLPETVVMLTFDDGLKDVVKYALPVLKRWDVPATVFCCSAPFEEQRLLNVHKIHLLQGELGVDAFQKKFEQALAQWHESYELEDPKKLGISGLYRYDSKETRDFKEMLNYRLPYAVLERLLGQIVDEVFGAESEIATQLYLSAEDIRHCQEAGLEIGLHTHNHHILSRLDETEQRRELGQVADYFKQNLALQHLHLAYPYGGTGTWNNITKRLLKELGFNSGFTMGRRIFKPDDLSNFWEIPRFDVRDVFQDDNTLRTETLQALSSVD